MPCNTSSIMLAVGSEAIIALALVIAFLVLLHVLFPTHYIGGGKIEMRRKPSAWLILIVLIITGILLTFIFFPSL